MEELNTEPSYDSAPIVLTSVPNFDHRTLPKIWQTQWYEIVYATEYVRIKYGEAIKF